MSFNSSSKITNSILCTKFSKSDSKKPNIIQTVKQNHWYLQKRIRILPDINTNNHTFKLNSLELGEYTTIKNDTKDVILNENSNAITIKKPNKSFDTIPDALAAISAGEFVVVLDDQDRENEGDLIIAADAVTPEKIAFMVSKTSGVICVGMEGRDLDRLQIPLMVKERENGDSMRTAFTVTVDLDKGVTTGISASDRSKTLKALSNVNSNASDFRKPGHIFPLRYHKGGVLIRPGHTEASVDLARLSGRHASGVLSEIVSAEGGEMARMPELLQFAKEHNLCCITIEDLVKYRQKYDINVKIRERGEVVTEHGIFEMLCYSTNLNDTEFVVLSRGPIHSEISDKNDIHLKLIEGDFMSDIFKVCKRGQMLDDALAQIASSKSGILIYVKETNDFTTVLKNHISSIKNDDEYSLAMPPKCQINKQHQIICTHILNDMGVRKVNLISDYIEDSEIFEEYGISINKCIPTVSNSKKMIIMGHDVDSFNML